MILLEANFYAPTRTNLGYSTYGYAPTNSLVTTGKKNAHNISNAARKVGSFLGKNRGKAGLAGVGLVGAGMLASKALSRPESLQSKLKKNSQLNQAANMASKMFR